MVWGTNLPPQPVILQPRPLQRNAGSILLVPLLPYRKVSTPLPTEVWTKIFAHVYYGDDKADSTPNVRRGAEQYRRDLLLICKSLTVRQNDPLTSSRHFLFTVSRIISLCWPASAEYRPSCVLLSRVDPVALAIGKIHDETSCR